MLCKKLRSCGETETILVDQKSNQLLAVKDSLSECEDYLLKILPLFPMKQMEIRVFNFQTEFPPITNLSRQLGSISAIVADNLEINLHWKSVKCAKFYEVLQKKSNNQERIFRKKILKNLAAKRFLHIVSWKSILFISIRGIFMEDLCAVCDNS